MCERVVCERAGCDRVACETVVCDKVVCVCDKVACGRTVGDAEEAADGCRRERSEEKQEPHTMMWGMLFPFSLSFKKGISAAMFDYHRLKMFDSVAGLTSAR